MLIPWPQLLNELSTCQSKLKKLAKTLVGYDHNIYLLCEDHMQAFQDQPTPEICIIATRLEKTQAKSKSKTLFYDPDHFQNSVIAHLSHFTYLNDPPTATVSASLLFCHLQLDCLTG